jgi:hypothetical protein
MRSKKLSRKNLAYIFPRQNAEEIEFQITQNLKKILRAHYRNFPSALKWLCAKTGVRHRTARNWYEGCNPPSSGHLLILARSYPVVLKMILQLAGRPDLAALCLPDRSASDGRVTGTEKDSEASREGAITCTINVTLSLNTAIQLNQRQLWFLGMLQQCYSVKAEHITCIWSVSLRTAKYDIAAMVDAKLITFVGARGTGRYIEQFDIL